MTRLRLIGKALMLPVGILLGVAVPGSPALAQPTGQWQFTGNLATGHSQTRLAQLGDGRVLAISGSGVHGSLTPTAEIYDPGTGTWAAAGSLNNARAGFGQPSALANGDVLVAGGTDVNVNDYATAELWNPATSQWTFTGNLNTARRNDVQVELANGEVLVATGASGPPTCGRFLSSAELYNPATGQWTYTGSALIPREGDTAIRLADGHVLLAGGYNGGSICTDTDPVITEIYDPATGQWSRAGDLPHGWMGGAMVLLPDHRVIMVDGWQHGSGNFAEAVIFDPATNQWSEAASPILPRSGAAATLLPDGQVLVSQGGQLQSEIYDPAANTWSLDATALDMNNGGQTMLLPNGKVLMAGGDTNTGPSTTAEVYTLAPPPCPQGTAANFRWHYSANASAGGWSATKTQHCPGTVSMGPQAMEGNLTVAPGATLQAGYDFTMPGNHSSLTMTVSAAQVTFAVSCLSGATPSASTFTVTMPPQTYQVTNDQWYPSGSQSSPAVYQGSFSVPDLCGGGQVRLNMGGTFTATLS